MKHYAIDGADDPALVKTPCGWSPNDLRPLSQQPKFAREVFLSAITRNIFEVSCTQCRIAMKRGKHVS